MLLALLLAGCSAQHRREKLFFTIRSSNTYEYAGKIMDVYELSNAIQEIDKSKYGFRTEVVLVAPADTPYSWLQPLRLLTSVRGGYSEYQLTTNINEPGQYFYSGSVGDSSIVWKHSEVNLGKGETYYSLDNDRIARLDNPKAFWANTNYGHIAYIVATPTTTVQRLIQELTVLNSYEVLPDIVDFDILSDDALLSEPDDSE